MALEQLPAVGLAEGEALKVPRNQDAALKPAGKEIGHLCFRAQPVGGGELARFQQPFYRLGRREVGTGAGFIPSLKFYV